MALTGPGLMGPMRGRAPKLPEQGLPWRTRCVDAANVIALTVAQTSTMRRIRIVLGPQAMDSMPESMRCRRLLRSTSARLSDHDFCSGGLVVG